MADLDRLRKVYALTDSPNENEAAAALAKLRAMLAAEGKAMRDLPALLAPAPEPTIAFARTMSGADFDAALRDFAKGIRPAGPPPPMTAGQHPDVLFLGEHNDHRLWCIMIGRARRCSLGECQATRLAWGMPSSAMRFSAPAAMLASARCASRCRDRSPPASRRFHREWLHSAALRRP